MTQDIQSTRRRYLLGLGSAPLLAGLSGVGQAETTSTATENGWPQFGYDAAKSGYGPDSRGPSLNVEQQWRYRSDGRGSSPTVADETVFVGLDDDVYAIDAADGSQQWEARWQRTITSTPAVSGEYVYVGAENKIYGLNRSNGETEWVASTSGRVTASPTVTDEYVVVGSQDNWMYALDRQTGTELWSHRTNRFDPVTAGCAIADGTVYYGDARGFVYARDLESGSQQWRYRCEGAIESAPSVVDGTVYVGDTTGRVYALAASDGTEQWTYESNSASASSVAVANETLYVGCGDGVLYALDTAGGSELWSYEANDTVHAPIVANGVVYAGSEDGSVFAINATEGTEQWRFDTGGPVETSPAVHDGILYVQSRDRGLFAIEQSVDAVISLNPERPSAGDRVRFDATESRPSSLLVSYQWEIDGRTLDGQTASYAFPTKGNQDIRLTVEDKYGNVDTTVRTIPISGQGPTADFSISPSDPSPGDTVIFSAGSSSDPDGEIVEYRWLIGTDSYSGLTVPFTIPEPGSYYVELTVTDNDGATDTTSTTVRVEEPATTVTTTPTPTETPTPSDTTTDTPTPTPGSAAGPPSGPDGGAGGGNGNSTNEWLQIGGGAVASLVGLAGWLHYDVTGGGESTEPVSGTPRAADGSGVDSETGDASDDGETTAEPADTDSAGEADDHDTVASEDVGDSTEEAEIADDADESAEDDGADDTEADSPSDDES